MSAKAWSILSQMVITVGFFSDLPIPRALLFLLSHCLTPRRPLSLRRSLPLPLPPAVYCGKKGSPRRCGGQGDILSGITGVGTPCLLNADVCRPGFCRSWRQWCDVPRRALPPAPPSCGSLYRPCWVGSTIWTAAELMMPGRSGRMPTMAREPLRAMVHRSRLRSRFRCWRPGPAVSLAGAPPN